MKKILHPSAARGHNRLSWLDSYHSFSFGHFYDENKINFGALRVLNDDTVLPGQGFGTHPHDNMEIVSIPLSGVLEHRDSMGSHGIIKSGDVQIMSAGTGISHSEFNHSKEEAVRFLQIWVFPRERQIEPRYDQRYFDAADRKNQWQVVVDPDGQQGVQIMQEAWFSLADISAGVSLPYQMHREGNGLYLFVLEGEIALDGELLGRRDAIGLSETKAVEISTRKDAQLLALEVPMQM